MDHFLTWNKYLIEWLSLLVFTCYFLQALVKDLVWVTANVYTSPCLILILLRLYGVYMQGPCFDSLPISLVFVLTDAIPDKCAPSRLYDLTLSECIELCACTPAETLYQQPLNVEIDNNLIVMYSWTVHKYQIHDGNRNWVTIRRYC